jgi:hypothetical protein
MDDQFVLVLTSGYDTPDVIGPFDSREEAEAWARAHGNDPDDPDVWVVLMEVAL